MKTLYLLHVACAALSIGGFALRGVWMLTDNPLRSHRLTKILPHVVDTLLLASALTMLVQWRLSPVGQPWLIAKLLALLAYIGLGMVALRYGGTRRIRGTAWLLALATAAYIVSVAFSKSAWGFLQALVS